MFNFKSKPFFRGCLIVPLIFAFASSTASAGDVDLTVQSTGKYTFDLIWTYGDPNSVSTSVRWYESVNGGPFESRSAHEGSATHSLTRPAGTYSFKFVGCDFIPPDFNEVCESGSTIKSITIQGDPDISDEGYFYEYDALGRLIKVKKDGRVISDYSYDKAGNRDVVEEVEQ